MNQKTNAKHKVSYVTVILIVTLVLVVAIVGYSLVNTLGIASQLSTAGESDNFKFNENIADVYRYINGQQEFSYYYQYLSMYLSLYSSYYDDTNSLLSMINNMDPMGGTFVQYVAAGKSGLEYVYDHIEAYIKPSAGQEGRFDEGAYSMLRQVLVYCEAARADENPDLYNTYKAEVQDDVDEQIEDMKETAKTLGVTFSSFRKRYMGDGVSEKEIREALEMQLIAAKYAEKINNEFLYDKTSTEDAEKWRDEHKADFYISSYFSINLYEKALYEDIKECMTLDEAAIAIADYYFEKNYDEQYKKYFGDTKNPVEDPNKDQTKKDIRATVLALHKLGDSKAVFTSSDTDDYKKAAYKVATGINTSTTTNKTSLKSEVEKITKRSEKTPTETAYVDLTDTSSTYSDLQKWLFKAERKTGDFEAITTSSTSSGTTTTSYTLYIAEDIQKWDTEKNLEFTKDIFYIQLTDDTTADETKEGETTVSDPKTAAEKAEIMYNALKDIKDEDEFADKWAELIEQYEPSSVGGSAASIRENVTESSLSDANLKAWVYSSLRNPGDLAILPLSAEDQAIEDAAADKADEETDVETETEAETETETKADEKDEDKEEEEDDIYLVYFVKENLATWEEDAREAIASDKLAEWFEAAVVKYNVSVDYEFETETETETKSETKSETKAETTAETKVESESDTEASAESESDTAA